MVFDLHGGGLESLIAALVRGLQGSHVHSSVITLGGRAGRVGDLLRPQLDHLDVLQPVRGVSMLAPVGLIRALRRQQPHIVHLHSGAWFKPAWGALLAGGAAVVYTEHGRVHYDPWTQRLLDRIAASWTARIVPVSDRLAEYMKSALRIPASRMTVIENGVDIDRFAPGPRDPALSARLGLPPGALVVGAVGRLEPVKGYDLLIRLFARLRQGGDSAAPRYLVLGGDGSQREPLAALAAELGVADRVVFAGWHDEPAALYRLFDVFAVSSRSEGLSLSLLEAMACGVAPVVTDVGANRLVLGDALGSLVHPGEAGEAFRASIEALLTNPGQRTDVGRACRQRVSERFSLTRVVNQYRTLYEELAAPPSA